MQRIAEADGQQIFVCAHSAHFVDIDDYRSISIVEKRTAKEGTSLRQCLDDIFDASERREVKILFKLSQALDAERSEMFFAKKIVLVEGPTERACVPYLARKDNSFEQAVSVIECGGKFNIPSYIRLLNVFRIPYHVIHDEDPLPANPPDDKDKRDSPKRIFKLNATISQIIDDSLGQVSMLSPLFEKVAGISGNQADKLGKPLAAMRHFETMADINDLPDELLDAVTKAYAFRRPPEELKEMAGAKVSGS